ncbi:MULTISPECIES: HK97-gp10 family putative phage morphogenesis protein [Cupriavidus]|uniref:HK97 gp10 family phage protein n=1 Tax=Cupriavidus campinensis TaxID=151783 RepID=A0AAE9KZM3_9BURK|nr:MULTISPECIES: HK97-gp10 family putative phage morphogenesis protein [Cupriavidus]URF02967.1 HK97 gp10 family phage protein [Cupriavidus campinensis]
MARKNFEVENAQALRDTLLALDTVASESVLRQAAVAGAREIFTEVKLRAPVDKGIYEGKHGPHPPGFLRSHIIIAYDDEVSVPGRIASYLVTWSKEAFYGRFLEFGTSKMAAQPFLRPAFEAKKGAAAAAVDEVIQTKVKELTRGQ